MRHRMGDNNVMNIILKLSSKFLHTYVLAHMLFWAAVVILAQLNQELLANFSACNKRFQH